MWGGRFAAPPSALLRALNDSFAFDRELFVEDVEGSIAWARALARAGVLTSAEAETIVNGLVNVPAPEEEGQTKGRGPRAEGREASAESTPTAAHPTRPSAPGPRPFAAEDVHSYVEAKLYDAIGP